VNVDMKFGEQEMFFVFYHVIIQFQCMRGAKRRGARERDWGNGGQGILPREL
jgi:hypothetical protein